jgi:hypothetical protein
VLLLALLIVIVVLLDGSTGKYFSTEELVSLYGRIFFYVEAGIPDGEASASMMGPSCDP